MWVRRWWLRAIQPEQLEAEALSRLPDMEQALYVARIRFWNLRAQKAGLKPMKLVRQKERRTWISGYW